MSTQAIAILINFFVIIFALVGTFLLVRFMKFDDNNSRIIFLLYIVYWITPLLCRDYTTSVNIHLDLGDNGFLMWIPVIAFGVVGIIWRPLNDILTYKTKSRKLIIYLSLLIEILTILPFMIYPCFATNIIQSVGCGVGASGIGLFTLMFNENQSRGKKFLSISIFALPPIIAGFLVSAMESFVASFIKEAHTNPEYLNTVWYIWLLGLIFIVTSFILVFFVKEKRETLYQDNKYKEPIVKAAGHWKMVLLVLCGILLSFFRWATAGPFSGMQLTYIATYFDPKNTSIWEGYLGLSYSFGCLLGSLISAWIITKADSKTYQPILVGSAAIIWIGFLVTNVFVVNVPTYFWTQLANGLGFGLLWNVLMEIVLNKFYFKQNIITPIGVFNMSLSLGICCGSLFIGLARYLFYDFHGSQIVTKDDFLVNNFVSSMVLIGLSVLLVGIFLGYFFLEKTHKERLLRTEKKIACIAENEL